RAALVAAALLAETWKAELRGLFVEDINLLRLSELPFAREILFAESELRRIEREEILKRLRARAAILRQEVQDIAAEYRVAGTFQVMRGLVGKELLAAVLDTDLLAVGRLGHTIAHRAPLGSTARAIIAGATSAVLLVRAEVAMGPIVALYDGSEVGRRVLDLALSLAERGGDLHVLVWAKDEAVAFETRQLATHILEPQTIEVQYQHLSGDDPQFVLKWISRQKASLLLLGAGDANLPDHIFQALLDEAEQNILVVR
ncbi:MAG TPA: universal stress protein, partial [Promineifilum sp.]|nr:universal stress protein [Promineifilum sp.]HRQ13921.1 universal stress protein [Promineifilum sp.]